MEYLGRVPAPPLDRFIDDIYCLTGVPRHRRMNVPPMPSAHLFINLGGPVRLGIPTLRCRRQCSLMGGSWAYGPGVSSSSMAPGCGLSGCTSSPGDSPFVDVPATELRDRWVPADAVWPRSLDRIRNQLGDIASATETLRVLEEELRSRLAGHRRAVSTWSSTPPGVWRPPTARSRSVR